MTITFLTYSSYTWQSIAVVTTATFIPVYLFMFITRQSRDRMSGVTHQNLISYISAICKPIHFWFSSKLSAVQGLQSKLQPEVPHTSGPISKFSTKPLKLGRRLHPFWGGGGSPSNTNSPGLRPTSIPSGILMHPAVWAQ